MFHLVHIVLPFWEVLESHEDNNILEEDMLEYRDVYGIFEHQLDVVDDEGLESLRHKYPQARTV